MTTHPGYPAGYHGLIECIALGLCWYCQVNPDAGTLEGYPICAKCKRKYRVKM